MAGWPADPRAGLRLSGAPQPAAPRWVCLDVGETLIDETRGWTVWAEVLGIPVMTFMAAFGAVVDRSRHHAEVFHLLGVPDPDRYQAEVARRYGGFQQVDLYPDVLRTIAALRATGHRVAIVANQPAIRGPELRALGVTAEVMGMSDAMGVWKPDAEFFRRALQLMGDPEAADVAYVGDRPDNDVAPSRAAGMRAVWLRRGPWGVIHQAAPGANLVVGSLDELVSRIHEAWAPEPGVGPLA
ncbi:MAG: HAD family hydrolase [Chloroflexota bacterium]